MGDTVYCPCCGEDVPLNRIQRGDRIEFTCLYCGFPLSPEEPSPTKAETETEPAPEVKKFRQVLVADDSKFTRKIIHDLLLEEKLAETVLSFENGLELSLSYVKLAEEKNQADIAIIDINMPVMDGIAAAQNIREIEENNNLPHIPIIFFSAMKADESLKSQMEKLSPANYVNKSTDPDPDRLAERIEQIFSYLKKTR